MGARNSPFKYLLATHNCDIRRFRFSHLIMLFPLSSPNATDQAFMSDSSQLSGTKRFWESGEAKKITYTVNNSSKGRICRYDLEAHV